MNQSFDNPVWTVTEVGGIYCILITIFGFLMYHLFNSIKEMYFYFKLLIRKWLKK